MSSNEVWICEDVINPSGRFSTFVSLSGGCDEHRLPVISNRPGEVFECPGGFLVRRRFSLDSDFATFREVCGDGELLLEAVENLLSSFCLNFGVDGRVRERVGKLLFVFLVDDSDFHPDCREYDEGTAKDLVVFLCLGTPVVVGLLEDCPNSLVGECYLGLGVENANLPGRCAATSARGVVIVIFLVDDFDIVFIHHHAIRQLLKASTRAALEPVEDVGHFDSERAAIGRDGASVCVRAGNIDIERRVWVQCLVGGWKRIERVLSDLLRPDGFEEAFRDVGFASEV